MAHWSHLLNNSQSTLLIMPLDAQATSLFFGFLTYIFATFSMAAYNSNVLSHSTLLSPKPHLLWTASCWSTLTPAICMTIQILVNNDHFLSKYISSHVEQQVPKLIILIFTPAHLWCICTTAADQFINTKCLIHPSNIYDYQSTLPKPVP